MSGHSHRNYFFDDGKTRIYTDNQVGYKGKRGSFKKLFINSDYDWFADYDDGIYEISKDDYETFYRGINEMVTINRQFDKLFRIINMFLMQSPKGRLSVLNGGTIKNVKNHSLEYFYENLTNYAQSVTMFLSNYEAFEKKVPNEVKKLGGFGRIHGSIVDIDFFNHLYINPLDGSITPYFVYSMTSKYVYRNLPSLLKCRCPRLYANFERLIGEPKSETKLVPFGKDLTVYNAVVIVECTEMYKISRILKGLQFTTKHNIVRLWNDALIKKPSEENGKLIVSAMINPIFVPQMKKKHKVRSITEQSNIKVLKPVLSVEEKEKIRNDKYKAFVLEQTGGNVIVKKYNGATEKADYKCVLCGNRWSTKPDHFKDHQKFKCPKCHSKAK